MTTIKKAIYRMISPIEILRKDMNLLGSIFDDTVIGNRQSKLAMRVRNQRILEAFFAKMSEEGFEFVGTVDYEALPYSGTCVFKKIIEIETDEETTDVPVDYERNAGEGDLYSKFENETGKNAVWHGKETKAYLEWKQKIIDEAK